MKMLFYLLSAISLQAVTLQWNPNPDASAYVLHWGTNSGSYLISTNVGGATNFTITNSNLFAGKNYFVLTGLNAAGDEIGSSAEVVYNLWPANLKTKITLALESSGQPIGPWQEVASIAYSDASLTNRFYRGKLYLGL